MIVRRLSSVYRGWTLLASRSSFSASTLKPGWKSTTCSHAASQRPYSQSCWKCDQRLRCPVAFCPGCETIQPPPSDIQNEFAILGLPESFDLSPKEISARYRSLAKKLHPDQYENKSDEERAISNQYSTQINQAYRTLMDPVSRARALLALRGVQVGDGDQITDMEFLEEIMELREKVQDADAEELDEIRSKTVDDLILHQDDFRHALAVDDLHTAKQAVIKLIYRARIMSAVCKD